MAAALAPMSGETPAQDPLSQVVPGKEDMGDDYDAIVVQMTQLMEHSDPAQKPPWDGSGLPETVAEMQALDAGQGHASGGELSSTHPSDALRISELERYLASRGW